MYSSHNCKELTHVRLEAAALYACLVWCTTPDLRLTTPDLSITGLEVTNKIGDHQMIVFTLEVHKPNTRTRQKQVLDYKLRTSERRALQH
ncbi:hypothetical protein FHG87_008017 [Trinorchestia longiramus]|nr:hypothetical protein FHG87_008017 [Trinorchestia longiramus]